MNKSIAIIGGTGFIGVNLANFFFAKGYSVRVTGRNRIEEGKLVSSKINVRYFDILDSRKLLDSVEGYEYIVWLVSNLIPNSSLDTLVDDFNYNIRPLITLLENSNKLGSLKKFVFMSSGGTIYGDSLGKTYLNESSTLSPISSYGFSKLLSENYIEFLSRNYSFQTIILRPSNVYGLHQNLNKPQGIIGFAFDSIIKNKEIILYNEGRVTRDFIHVDDLANALFKCLETDSILNQVSVYNVGSNIGLTIAEILQMLTEITKKDLMIKYMPARPIDCNYNVLDINKIQNELHWVPEIPLKVGLENMWSWILKKNGDIVLENKN
jgi:UDP-glucose 4-epimerase